MYSRPNNTIVVKRWVREEKADSPDFLEDCYSPLMSEEELNKIIEAAKEKASKIIQEAQEEAELLTVRAYGKVAEIEMDAQKKGYEEGMRRAKENEIVLAQQYQEEFNRALKQLKSQRDQRDESLEQAILRLSMDVAKKVVHTELEENNKVFISLIKAAINRLNAKEKFTITVSQSEYDRFFAKGSGWLEELVQAAPFTIMVDPNANPGDLRLTSPNGTVDAGISSQLDKLETALEIDESKDGQLMEYMRDLPPELLGEDAVAPNQIDELFAKMEKEDIERLLEEIQDD